MSDTLQKPTAVFLGHQRWLFDHLLKQPALLERVAVRDLIRESAVLSPVAHTEIKSAMDEAAVLVIGPCRSSMYPQARSSIAEQYAVDLACEAGKPIALCISEHCAARPPYIEKALGNVRIVATFGLNLQQTQSGYLIAWHTDLFALPKGVGLAHPHFQREQRQEHFPGNVREFAYALSRLAQP